MSDDKLLYHYTTVESLVGIFNTRELWASHVRYLNDTSEQHLMWDVLKASIESKLKDAEDTERERIAELQQYVTTRLAQNIYIVSFSTDGGDRLSQWRGYGGASGVAIGFNRAQLNRTFITVRIVNPNEPSTPPPLPKAFCYLQDVKYIDPSGDEPSNQFAALRINEPITTSDDQGLDREQVFSRGVSTFAAHRKHIVFEEEKETRLIIFDYRDLLTPKFRHRKSMMIPYVPFELGHELWPLISRVVIGPSPHQHEIITAIRMMLDGRTDVVASKIPYRDW